MQVKAIRNCFVAGAYRKEGEEFDYSGPPNENLQPQDKADQVKWAKGTFKGPQITGAAAPAKPPQPEKAAQPEEPAQAEKPAQAEEAAQPKTLAK